MSALKYPTELNGIPLSDRTRHLMFAPLWMLIALQRERPLFDPALLEDRHGTGVVVREDRS